MKQFKSLFILLLGTILLLTGSCCEDCPVCPENPPEAQQHYKMYVGARDVEAQKGLLLVMDIPADTVIDSVTVTMEKQQPPAEAASTFWMLFALTPDNSRLLIQGGSNTTVVFKTNDLSYDTTLDYCGDYHFDRIRSIGLVNTINGLFKFNPDDFQLTDSLSRQFAFCQLDTANAVIYLIGLWGEDVSTVYRVDYLTMTLIDSLLIRDSLGSLIMIYEMLPIADYDRLYFFGKIVGMSFSFIYDLQNKRIISSVPHSTAFGNFLGTADGQTVYMSDPGNLFFDIYGSNNIWLYSVPDDSVVGFYSTLVSDALGTRHLDIQDMILTPDGRYLYGGCSFEPGLIKYDLSTGLGISLLSKLYPPLLPSAIEIGEKIK